MVLCGDPEESHGWLTRLFQSLGPTHGCHRLGKTVQRPTEKARLLPRDHHERLWRGQLPAHFSCRRMAVLFVGRRQGRAELSAISGWLWSGRKRGAWSLKSDRRQKPDLGTVEKGAHQGGQQAVLQEV